jgi:hypothetical protein
MSPTVTISAIIIASIFISLVVGQTCPAGTNLIQNPSFENPVIASGTSAQLPLDGITSWTGVSVNGNCPTPGTVELNNNFFGPASDGTQYVALDAQCNTALIQRFPTVPGQLYVLSYDYSPQPGVDAPSDVANVYFNGERINSVSQSGLGLTTTNWTTYTQLVTGAGPDELVFEGLGIADAAGSLIDNVYLCPLVCQPPPPCYTLTMDPVLGCNYVPSPDGTPCSTSCSRYVCQMGVCVPPPVPCDQPQDHHYYPGSHYEHKEYKYQQNYGHHDAHYGYGYTYTQYPVQGYKPPYQPQYPPQTEYKPKHYGDDDDYEYKPKEDEYSGYKSEEKEYKPKESEYSGYKSEEEEYKPKKEYKSKDYGYKSEESEYKPKKTEYKPKDYGYEEDKDDYDIQEYKPKEHKSEYKPKDYGYKSEEEDEYKPKESEYKPKKTEYKSKDYGYEPEEEESEYKPKKTEYKPKDHGYKPEEEESEYKPKESEYKPKKEYKSKDYGYEPEEEESEYKPKKTEYKSKDYGYKSEDEEDEYKPKEDKDDYGFEVPDYYFDEDYKADDYESDYEDYDYEPKYEDDDYYHQPKYSSGSGRRSHH